MSRHDPESDDLEILEPLAPGSGAALRTVHRAAPAPATRRGQRRRLVAGGLATISLVQFGAAAYVASIAGDLRALDEAWDPIVAVDADRDAALAKIDATAAIYGESAAVHAQRELVYDAAEARIERLAIEIDELEPGSGRLKALQAKMLETITVRRRDLRSESIPPERNGALVEISAELRAAFRRWHIREPRRDEPPARLTAARELVERLDRMADRPTGLTIGAINAGGLYVIDVDGNRVRRHELPLSERASVHPVDDRFVVVDGGVARAFVTSGETDTVAESWTTSADRAVSTRDGTSVWIQTGRTLTRLDAAMQVRATVELPDGARLVRSREADGAIVALSDGSLATVSADGTVTPAPNERRVRASRPAPDRSHAVALDATGRVLIAPIEDRPFLAYTTLRHPLPRFFAIAVAP